VNKPLLHGLLCGWLIKLTEHTHHCLPCAGNILVRILLTVLEKALLLPRWQRMDYQTSFSTLYSIIPNWMVNQYGKHPATVSPTAAFVMLDVGPSISHCFVPCMEL